MRNLVGLVLVIGSLNLLVGCAQVGPYAVDPKVYSTSRDAIAAGNKASEEKELSSQFDQQLYRARANYRHQFVGSATQPQAIYQETSSVTGQSEEIGAQGYFNGFHVFPGLLRNSR